MMEDLEYDPPSKAFHDVRFVLLGFDAINKSKVLSKLVDGGGVDVGQYGPICTHVIVDKLIYDDPICIAARSDGKTLVNDLWVAHSFDAGMPVDATNVMYRPLRDLKGIPGANSLVVCLTGYQRQDRDDIMTMVSQIGATFSKPLVANKVTHLICYKFEGEKYELAKKIKKIKLVNHMWLEDCLKAWEILPEADYDKSGYELEVLEAEAKDSEEVKQQLLNPKQEFKGNQLDSSASRGPSNVVNTNDIMVSATGKEKTSYQNPNLPEIHIKHPEVLDRLAGDVCSSEPVKSREKTAVAASVGNELASTSGTEKSPVSNNANKSTPKSYSRKTQRKTPPAMDSGEMAGNLKTTPTVKGKFNLSDGSLRDGSDNGGFKTPEGTVLHPEGQSSKLDEITKIDVPYCSTKSQKVDHDSKTHSSAGSPEMNKSQLLEPNNDNHNSSPMAALSLPQRSPAKISKLKSSSVGRKSPKCDTPVSETVDSKIGQDGNLVVGPHSFSVGSKMASLASKLVSRDVLSREEHATGESPKVSSPKSKRLEIENASGSKPPTRKKLARKSGSKGGNDTTNLKGSIYLNKSVAEDDPAVSPIGVEETAGINKNEVVPPAVDLYTDLGGATNYVSNSRNKVDQKSMSIDDETEPPEDKEENEVVEAVSEQKYGVFDPVSRGEDDKSEDLLRNRTKLGGTKQKEVACGKRKLGESTNMQEVTKESNTNRGKKRTLSKIKKTTIPSEAQDFMAEVELPKAVSKENYTDVEAEIVGNVEAEDKLEEMKTFDPEDKDGSKQKKGISGKRKLGESTLMENSVTENVSRGKKRPLFKSKKTTTPSEVPENKVPEAVAEDNYGEVRPNDMGNVGVEDKSEGKAGTKKKKGTSGNKRELGESTHLEDVVDENINAGKKRSVGNLKKSTGPSVTKINKLKEAANEEAESQKNDGRKTKKAETVCKLGKSVEMEKENMPLCDGDQNVSRGKNLGEKLAPKKASRKIDAGASNSNLDGVQKDLKSEPEPARFLLSAHKLQRREFQQIIKQLKGKACRDSHQWSYQATHLIVAEPVRRTEKFFAAAASGRWILKTDYLIDSNQAGKFLPEEAYEWKKSDTSEDGNINLEAPRKWRLQRERTGHGAFYGMRVVIYGECIAPSLETIKRVVKAGEGIILATSPPYTRFLKSGFDFALVSPGMLQDDMWIQEFLRHEIPCVAADYLVEFICKPGYPLDRHVQYDTHAWAEKSLNNLINRAVAIVRITTSPLPSNDDIMMTPPNDGDVACQVCASRDRGEEMLICGDESGAVGCGVGMHIDCCDPPLADVPEEDWFCPKCRESKSSGKKRTLKSAKKKTPVSKRN